MSSFAETLFNIEVIIVGAGVAGASAALYLARSGVSNVHVLECGKVGKGVQTGRALVPHACIRDGDVDTHPNESSTAFPFARMSGTAAFDPTARKNIATAASEGISPPCDDNVSAMKMMLVIFPCSSKEFILHHGIEGAKRYLKLAQQGIYLEKKLATELLKGVPGGMKELGSLYVCTGEDVDEFREEFETLSRLIVGTDIAVEWWDDEEKVQQVSGCSSFVRAIWFPGDAVIDSSAFSRALLKAATQTGCVTLVENCPSVVGVETIDTAQGPHAIVQLSDGSSLKAKHVVVATGGLFMERNLAGILTPCWSYIVSLKDLEGGKSGKGAATREGVGIDEEAAEATSTNPNLNPNQATCTDSTSCGDSPALPSGHPLRLRWPDSPNFFTWGFSHDWCLTRGFLRCSGEDHFSALKPPRAMERCQALAEWALEKYPYLEADLDFRYGVYSETPDRCAIVGIPHPDSRICYLLGCNASGQAPLSFAASLIPGLLGYRRLTEEQLDLFKVMNIRRFALLQCVMEKNTGTVCY